MSTRDRFDGGTDRTWTRQALEVLLDILFPPACVACERLLSPAVHDAFCIPCGERVQPTRSPLCQLCGRPYPSQRRDDHLCGACLLRPPAFSAARSWACYPRDSDVSHPLRQVIHRFKYGRQAALGHSLGRLMAQACRPWFRESDLDLIVPVPLHPRRLRWRGFNQSVVLGREVGREWGMPLDPFVLVRKAETAPQSTLSLNQRGLNVRGAFRIAPRRNVKGLRLLLVDDVYTSGATVNECARVLVRSGAREVRVLTLGRTVS